MGKADISENIYTIKKVIRVIRAENKNLHKRLFVKERPSDVLVYIISGSCDYYFGDGTHFTVKSGNIMFLPKGESYTIYVTEPNYRFIFCDFEFCDTQDKKGDVFIPKNTSSAEKLFVKLLNTYNMQSKTCFTDLLSILYSIYSEIISSGTEIYLRKSVKTKILDMKTYVDKHFNDLSLAVSELSQKIDMSDVYFRKLFKAEIGVSPSEYITSVRLKKAKEMMSYYPFLTLEECALQSGFSSLQYFSRVFSKEFGITPSKYRKNKEKI